MLVVFIPTNSNKALQNTPNEEILKSRLALKSLCLNQTNKWTKLSVKLTPAATDQAIVSILKGFK